MQTMRLVLSGVFLMTLFPAHHQAQSAVNVKYGIMHMQFADAQSVRQYGQSLGFDVIVEDTRVLFMPGMHYQQFAIQGKTSRGGLFRDYDRFHQINVPMSFGTWLVGDRFTKLRIYGGGHLNFLIGVDKNNQGVTIDNVTLFHPGVQGGVQLLLWRFTADFRYSHDFRNVINSRPESKLRGWEFLLGFVL